MQPRLGCGPVARGEDRVVDARWNDPDVVGVGAVEPDQLSGLRRRGGQDPVGGSDHALLALQPEGRLGSLSAGEGIVLDLAEGVERGHEWSAPQLLGRAADPAREPVVAVHDVVGARFAAGVGKHASEELRQESGKVGLRDRGAGSRLDAHHPRARREVLGLVIVAPPAPCEHVELQPLLGQPLRDLADVDVHPARVAAARLVHGRGVDRQHRHARCGRRHGSSIPSSCFTFLNIDGTGDGRERSEG